MKILIATVIWKRHELFKKFVFHHKQFGADILVIGSEGELSKKLCEELGCIYIEYENKPLKEKFNQRALFFLNNTQYTHLLLLGSDNFIDREAFDYVQENAEDFDVISWTDLYIYSPKEDELVYCDGYRNYRAGEPYAPGRCISRKVVEDLNGVLWEMGDGHRSPDFSLWKKLKRYENSKKISAKSIGGFIVDVKTDININSYNKIKKNQTPREIVKTGETIDSIREMLERTQQVPNVQIGKFNLIHPSVVIGKGTEIGNFCIISEGVIIGENTKIGNRVEIRNCDTKTITKIGSDCVIESGVFLDGTTNIEDGVFIGPSCEIKNNVLLKNNSYLQGKNRIANNCIIGESVIIKYGSILTSNVDVGRDSFIGPNTIFTGDEESRNAEAAGEKNTSRVGKRVFIGANTCFMPGVEIGNDCVVGACSFVRHDIPKDTICYGNPCKVVRKR